MTKISFHSNAKTGANQHIAQPKATILVINVFWVYLDLGFLNNS